MDYRFLVEIIALKPPLFQAILNFNREGASPLPEELSSLGEPFAALWQAPAFRRAWPASSPEKTGYWNFSEESQRLALLERPAIVRLGLFFSAAVHAEEISRVIAREQVLELRRTLGADILSYALRRGRYQVGALRSLLLVPDACGSLSRRISLLAVAAPLLVSEDWPEELRRLASSRLPQPDEAPATDRGFSPSLRRGQRRALWFTMKKLLLREVAPEWAPCFD